MCTVINTTDFIMITVVLMLPMTPQQQLCQMCKSTQRKMAKRRTIICVAAAACVAVGLYVSAVMITSVWKGEARRDLRGDPATCGNSGTWESQTKTCICKLGWIGKDCSIWYDHSCYFDDGKDYRGTLSVTRSGRACKLWTSAENQRFKLGKHGIGIHNHCRNPDGDEKGLWCYVGGATLTEYCNATKCPDGVKYWLTNQGDNAPASDTNDSDAVQFLYGPLISGICAGITILIAAIALCECVCRRRMYPKIENSEGNDKQESTNASNKTSIIDIEERNIPLGGREAVATVDVDSGRNTIVTHQHPVKCLHKDSETQTNTETLFNGVPTQTEISFIGLPSEPQTIYSITEFIGSSSRHASKCAVSTMTSRYSNAVKYHVIHGRAATSNKRYIKKRRRKRAHEPPHSSSDSEEVVISPTESSATSTDLSNHQFVKSNTEFAKRRRRRKPRASSSARTHSADPALTPGLQSGGTEASHLDSGKSRTRNNLKTMEECNISDLGLSSLRAYSTLTEQSKNKCGLAAVKQTNDVKVHKNERALSEAFPDTYNCRTFGNYLFEP